MAEKTAYEKLKNIFAEISGLGEISSFLSKDAQTHMPKGARKTREWQMVSVGNAAQRLISDPRLAGLLDQAEANKESLPPEDRRNLALMRHDWIHNASLPDELAEEKINLDSQGENLHDEHYKSGDWSKMKPWYEHSFDVMRRVGAAKKDALGLESTYDALLDQFSPGITTATVERVFGELSRELPSMIKEALTLQKAAPAPLPLKGSFPKEKQMELNRRVATAMGFDIVERGRLDAIDGHPSSGGAPDDNWITVRIDELDFTSSLFAVIHESGHGMYEQGLPEKWRNQPAGTALGMAIHESQSRVMEVQAGITPEFISWISEQAINIFGDQPALEASNLRRLIQRANPSFIRVEADELTYPMHVALRFELEKAIIEGTLAVADLPQAWNDGIEQRLGIRPKSNAQGCMQDVHWPIGAIGYFPAYTLGDMLAAQLFHAAQKQYPDIRKNLAKGDFTQLRDWLRENVHSKGSLMTAEEMIFAATGEPLTARYYLNHLSERYLGRPFTPQSSAPQQSNGGCCPH